MGKKSTQFDSVRLGRQQGRGHWKSSTSTLTGICIYLSNTLCSLLKQGAADMKASPLPPAPL